MNKIKILRYMMEGICCSGSCETVDSEYPEVCAYCRGHNTSEWARNIPDEDIVKVAKDAFPELYELLESKEAEQTTAPSDIRQFILRTAEHMVCGHRQQDYGKPEDSFAQIARLWNAYLEIDKGITSVDVAMMMALLKMARIQTGSATQDSFVDLAGYAACGAEIALGGKTCG